MPRVFSNIFTLDQLFKLKQKVNIMVRKRQVMEIASSLVPGIHGPTGYSHGSGLAPKSWPLAHQVKTSLPCFYRPCLSPLEWNLSPTGIEQEYSNGTIYLNQFMEFSFIISKIVASPIGAIKLIKYILSSI